MGIDAGLSMTTGESNTFVGQSAGQSNSFGFENVFCGTRAGFHTTGSYNTFVGTEAGLHNTSGNFNVAVGRLAGSNNTTGSRNTFIGDRARPPEASDLTNATAIGNQAQVSQSDSLVLGSIVGINGAVADTNVGIGTTAPAHRLHVVAEDETIAAVYGTNSAVSGTAYGVRGDTESADGRGVFGWAKSSSGTNYGVRGQSSSASGYDFFASGVGTDYGSSSSIRWKRNVEQIDNPLYKLSRLRGVYFDWDEEHGSHHDVGMIAEEVGEVLPEIVQYEANGVDAHGMDYGKLTPLLVEALKELNTRHHGALAAHQQELADIKNENNALRERLATLELLMQEVKAQVSEKMK